LLATGKFGNVPGDVKLRLTRIDQQADRLVKMINEVLDIARIEFRRVCVAKEELDLAEVTRETIEGFLPQLQQKKITINTFLPDKLMCRFDKNMIVRVLVNLLSNAIKFTPEEGEISVALEDLPDKVRLSVKDTGMGIPEEDLDNVFREFYRLESTAAKNVEGTGLGLSLVKNIIKAHGGKIWAESKAGEGAKFTFVLPKE